MKNIQAVPTEGVKYAGSKLRIIPHIVGLLDETDNVRTVLDGFSGTSRVAQAFARLGFTTTANDLSHWSEVFATCYLKADKPVEWYAGLIEHLNGLKGYEGWFNENYGGDPDYRDARRPFQRKNTQRLDAIRDEIDRLDLSNEDRCVLLTSLIRALDEVDNTLGHYAAYLSGWSKRSYKDLKLKVPAIVPHEGQHRVFRRDVFETIAADTYDLAYFDPPYGANNHKMPSSRIRYNAYYHLWKTIILNDKPNLFGKAMRREDSRDTAGGSVFEEFRSNDEGQSIAREALRDLLQQARARYILLSYSSGGKVTREEILDLMTGEGELVKALEIDHRKNVMSAMRTTHEWVHSDHRHHEYLFLMKK